MKENLQSFYLNKPESIAACLQALRSIILEQDIDITETIKYGMPCFCYKNKAICYLWTDKKTGNPYILMVEGQHLDHPKLESGERKRMKVLNIDPNKDLPLKTIQNILSQALNVLKLNKV